MEGPRRFDKQLVIDVLHRTGRIDKLDQAVRELPDLVEYPRDAQLLGELGIPSQSQLLDDLGMSP